MVKVAVWVQQVFSNCWNTEGGPKSASKGNLKNNVSTPWQLCWRVAALLSCASWACTDYTGCTALTFSLTSSLASVCRHDLTKAYIFSVTSYKLKMILTTHDRLADFPSSLLVGVQPCHMENVAILFAQHFLFVCPALEWACSEQLWADAFTERYLELKGNAIPSSSSHRSRHGRAGGHIS